MKAPLSTANVYSTKLGISPAPLPFQWFNLYGVNSPQLAAISWSIPSDTPLLAAGFFIELDSESNAYQADAHNPGKPAIVAAVIGVFIFSSSRSDKRLSRQAD